MTNLKDKIKTLGNWIKENPKKSILGIGLAGLIATTALKDNVHFGSVTLNNPQENHYVWGILPTTKIQGVNSKGNIYTLGLVGGGNPLGDNSQITGDMNAYGLFVGKNELGDNSQITGNMNAYGLIGGVNELGDNSQITGNMNAYGLFFGENNLGNNSQITGNMGAYSLFIGNNALGNNSQITGNISNKGLFVYNSVAGSSLGSNDVKGLENYVHKTEEEIK